RSILHRRHRDLAMDLPFRMADDRPEAVSECEALVRDDRGASGSSEGLQGAEGHGPCADAVGGRSREDSAAKYPNQVNFLPDWASMRTPGLHDPTRRRLVRRRGSISLRRNLRTRRGSLAN